MPRVTSRHAEKEEIKLPRRLRTEENMVRNLFFAALAVVLMAGIGYANQSTSTKVVILVSRTSATSGKQMYVNYCAPCHGVDGRGQGPVAAVLKKQPAVLALLSKNNGGKYPSLKVSSSIRGESTTPAHGSKDMPVWGTLFWSMSSGHEGEVQQRVTNLTHYIESLQAK